jgi:signal transduction histidine kinase
MDAKKYAFIEMAFDFIGSILKSSDNPEESSKQLAYQLRELTGAGIVILFEINEQGYLQVTHCNPERKIEICKTEKIIELANITIEDKNIIDWRPVNGKPQCRGTEILLDLRFDISLGVPLLIGKEPVGCVLLLNIPSLHGFDLVIDNMQMLSGIMALIMRNAMLFHKQEKIIRQRTQALIEAKEQAEKSEQVKSVFLANMTHEVRSPINGILGFSEILENDNITDNQRKHYISLIRKSGKHLLSLVNDIIDLTRLESDKVKLINTALNINEIFQDQYELFHASARSKGIKLSYEKIIEVEDSWIMGDPLRLTQIITNLINNAIKFTNTGTINFGCHVQEENIEFFVQDTGIGISEAQIENIFGRYNQAQASHAGIQKGMGLGLSIVKGLISQMKGKIWVESEKDKGSTFRFTLPRVRVDMKDIKVETTPPTLSSSLNGHTFLLAEDDPIVKKYYDVVFEMANAQLITTDNGRDAVELYKNNQKISLILLDLDMPFMNGLEALEAIRSFDIEVPIIVQTAYVSTNEKQKSIDLGANGFIAKPINRQELLNLINDLL